MSDRSVSVVPFFLSSRRVLVLLTGTTMLFAAAHAALVVLRFRFEREYVLGFGPLFHLNREGNLPTLFSTLLLLGCAAVSAIAAADDRRRGRWGSRYWTGLVLVFAFMALDEAASIHERIGAGVQARVDTAGALHFAWVMPYGLIAAFILLLYLRFLARLPRSSGLGLVLAGALYVGGALGVEIFQGLTVEASGYGSLALELSFLVEEPMEMLGTTFFIYTVLRLLETRGGVSLQVLMGAPIIAGGSTGRAALSV